MSLSKIVSDAQMVCDAIASVVNIDVTIVDEHLVRIAGTGRYRETIGSKVGSRSAFQFALENKEAFIIENPGAHEACLDCECKEKCSEHAEMCCPIDTGERIAGVIGLIAFEPEQRKALIENQSHLMQFLSKMSELIASKLKEQASQETLALMAQEMKVAMDAVDIGFVVSDENGKITRVNRKGKKLFRHVDAELDHLDQILGEAFVKNSLPSRDPFKNRPLRFPNGNKGIYDMVPVFRDEVIKGYVITVTPLETVLQTVNAMTQDLVMTHFQDILGDSDALNLVKATAQKVADQNSTVMILGESGTGKELFARAIHSASKRSKAPFITLNCAAIPDTLLESELFGYEEGAFTGAKRGGKPGKFLLANGGTLFLDEIGDMPLHLQAKLLRVLQEQTIEPIGGLRSVKVDVRVLAATHQNLDQKVLDGAFRQDLYYRLNVIPLVVPPLRERRCDITLLAKAFLIKCNHKLDKKITNIHPNCLKRMENYPWPGNVRELMNVMEYAVNMCDGEEIQCGHLPKHFIKYFDGAIGDTNPHVVTESLIVPLETLEKEAIKKALHHFKDDKSAIEKAANALGLSRATLYRKIKAYGLD